jgi:hypothetical protein
MACPFQGLQVLHHPEGAAYSQVGGNFPIIEKP